MRFASVAEVKDHFSEYLAQAKKKKEPVLITHHGKPCALLQPISEQDLEALSWGRLAKQRLQQAWKDDDDALYDYL
jgi:prevent-host-death family protein